MHHTYVLLSSREDNRFYTGCTDDLKKRVLERNAGRVRSTAYQAPLELIYYEACLSRDDAFRRERLLKIGKGKRFLKKRLAGFPDGISRNKLERH
ncbi:MAG: GIY-YIG nuclease family protein [Acidobacteriota bacterium]